MLTHLRNAVRRLHGLPPVMRCGCPIATVAILDGQHPWSCKHHDEPFGDITRFRVGVLEPHQVDGVVMPWAGLASPDLARRWCDLSELGDGNLVARRYVSTDHFAMVTRSAGRVSVNWHWTICARAGAADGPDVVEAGDTGTLRDALDAVGTLETKFELAALA